MDRNAVQFVIVTCWQTPRKKNKLYVVGHMGLGEDAIPVPINNRRIPPESFDDMLGRAFQCDVHADGMMNCVRQLASDARRAGRNSMPRDVKAAMMQ